MGLTNMTSAPINICNILDELYAGATPALHRKLTAIVEEFKSRSATDKASKEAAFLRNLKCMVSEDAWNAAKDKCARVRDQIRTGFLESDYDAMMACTPREDVAATNAKWRQATDELNAERARFRTRSRRRSRSPERVLGPRHVSYMHQLTQNATSVSELLGIIRDCPDLTGSSLDDIKKKWLTLTESAKPTLVSFYASQVLLNLLLTTACTDLTVHAAKFLLRDAKANVLNPEIVAVVNTCYTHADDNKEARRMLLEQLREAINDANAMRKQIHEMVRASTPLCSDDIRKELWLRCTLAAGESDKLENIAMQLGVEALDEVITDLISRTSEQSSDATSSNDDKRMNEAEQLRLALRFHRTGDPSLRD